VSDPSPNEPTGFAPVSTPPPERRPTPWLEAFAVVVVVVLIGFGVWLVLDRNLLGGSATPSPSPSPTPVAEASPSPTAPTTNPPASESPSPSPDATPSGSPTATPDGSGGAIPPEIAAQIDEVVAGVPPIRQLEPLREVPYEFVTREQFAVDLQEMVDEETDPEQLAAEERVLKRLGLLPDDMDLYETLLELYGSQVAAFYRPDTGTFYIIGETGELSAMDRVIVAHEYTHALQDQHYDLEGTRIIDPAEGDAALAQTAAIEGDASLVMLQWAYGNLSPDEILALGSELNPADLELLESMPPILRRQLEFPYNEGLFFALEVFASDFGWGAINGTLESPPPSTEQILHSDKFFADEQPVPVAIPDLSDALGSGWSTDYSQTFGELGVQVWVGGGEQPSEGIPGLPAEQPHAEAAAGWGGDRLVLYEDGADGWAIVWELAWDTPQDTDEFLARALELQATLDGESLIRSVAADRVQVLVAHDQATLDTMAGALGR
jgi:hypothetical protein